MGHFQKYRNTLWLSSNISIVLFSPGTSLAYTGLRVYSSTRIRWSRDDLDFKSRAHFECNFTSHMVRWLSCVYQSTRNKIYLLLLGLTECKIAVSRIFCSNVAALLRKDDRGVPALIRKTAINWSAVNISIWLHLSEWQICIFWPLTTVVSFAKLFLSYHSLW